MVACSHVFQIAIDPFAKARNCLLLFGNTAVCFPDIFGIEEIFMRLTCPNCGAQYEVPDDVIPEEGRDVQCSNCGDTWFQMPDGMVAKVAPTTPNEDEAAPDAGAEADGSPVPEAEIEFGSASDPGHAPEPENAPDREPEEPDPNSSSDEDSPGAADSQKEEAPEPAAGKSQQSPTQRGLDPALGDILREEAEREANLRAAEQDQSQGLETQTSLGLDNLPENEEARRSRQAKDRMARIQGQDPRRLAAEASGLKRGVLPDIEEINSTLRAGETPPPPAAPDMTPRPRKSGFTRGFALVILLAVVMVMAYSNAPQIAEVVPQADPYLSSYVAWVDEMRLWLDAQVTALQQSQR